MFHLIQFKTQWHPVSALFPQTWIKQALLYFNTRQDM